MNKPSASKIPKTIIETTAKRRKKPRKILSLESINAIFEIFAADNPEPKTELQYSSPYTLLVAVTLSAQATDISVNKATKPLFQIADNPAAMVALGVEGLKQYIKTIGLYNNKAKNVIALSQQLLDNHAGQVPADRSALEALPGVGRKTANVVLNVAFNMPTMAVDTHIFRVGNRTGMAPGSTTLAVEEGLLNNIPEKWLLHAHHWLILHGRYVCKARTPLCSDCKIKSCCQFYLENPPNV